MIIILTIIIFLLLLIISYFYFQISNSKYHTQISETQLKTKEKTNEEKIKFYISITQEMCTPIFMISAQIEELRVHTSTLEQVPLSYLDSIYSNSIKLNQQISKLIEFNKKDSNKKKINLQHKNIVAFCNNLSEDYRHLCEQKDINFRFFSEKDNVEMDFDSNKLENIITYLISNSFEYTRKKGTIILELKDRSDEVSFSIKNNGIDVRKKIFYVLSSLFIHLKKTAYQRNHRNMKSFTESLNYIKFTEHKNYKGSEFIFTIPKNFTNKSQCHNKEEGQSTEEKVPTVTQQPGNPIALHSILIIDKERDLVSLLERNLSSDYKIYKAYDEEEGLKIARTSLPDMIVCDLLMPRINSFKFLQTLKKDKKLQHIKIIIFTTRISEDNMIKAFNCGADAYLTKNISLKYLRIRIKKMFDQIDDTNIEADIKKNYNKEEQLFLLHCREIIDDNLRNENFNISRLAEELAMSHSSLYKKIKVITGLSLIEFINEYKIYKSVELFNQGQSNIETVCEQCGFNDSKNFRKMFTRKMKMTPKQYVNSLWHKS